jgi:hypothetical protein
MEILNLLFFFSKKLVAFDLSSLLPSEFDALFKAA